MATSTVAPTPRLTDLQMEYLRLLVLEIVDEEVKAQAEREDFSRYNDFYRAKYMVLFNKMSHWEWAEVERIQKECFDNVT